MSFSTIRRLRRVARGLQEPIEQARRNAEEARVALEIAQKNLDEINKSHAQRLSAIDRIELFVNRSIESLDPSKILAVSRQRKYYSNLLDIGFVFGAAGLIGFVIYLNYKYN